MSLNSVFSMYTMASKQQKLLKRCMKYTRAVNKTFLSILNLNTKFGFHGRTDPIYLIGN